MDAAAGVMDSVTRPRHITHRQSLRRAGARSCARVRVAAALAVALVSALAVGPTCAGPRPDVTVTVQLDHQVYEVQGQFEATSSRDVAWATLIDYEHITTFVSSLRKSAVERRDTNRFLVRQEGVMGIFPFRSVVRVLLDIREQPQIRIQFRDVLGSDFHAYSGEWALDGDSTHVHVKYTLRARPCTAAPHAIGRRVLSHTIRDMLSEVRREMLRRAANGPPRSTR